MPSIYDLEPGLLLNDVDQRDIAHFFQELNAPGWVVCYQDKEGCVVSWRSDPSCPIILVKGVTKVRAPVKKVADFIGDDQHFEKFMKTCDKMVKTSKVVEVVDAKHFVKHSSFHLPPPLWPRDFCWAETHTRMEDGSYLDLARSVEHPKCPPTHGRLISAVRGQIVGSGYWVQPIVGDSESCMVHYQVQCDPKGLIPTAVVNMVCKDQGKNAKRLKEYFEK